MAVLSQQTIVDTGLSVTYGAASAGGDTFVNDGSEKQFLHVKNANVGSARVITVSADVSTTTKPGFPTLDVDDIVVSVPLSDERMIGPIPLTAYGASTAITYDDEADVTLALIKI